MKQGVFTTHGTETLNVHMFKNIIYTYALHISDKLTQNRSET